MRTKIIEDRVQFNERIHIALSPWDLTDKYNRHAGVTMLSALNHCSRPVTVHLLYDANLSKGKEDEEEYNRLCYQKIAERYNCNIEYHHIDLPKWIYDIPAVKKWTAGTLLRLYLPEISPHLEKILYLDCDMVINTNIDELWDIPLGDAYLAACPDSSIPSFVRKRVKDYTAMGINYKEYFCAGILILNLNKLRNPTRPFTETVISYFKKNQNLKFLDQDLLNWYCQGNYIPLDEKTNIYTWREDARKFAEDCILHYATKNSKPWAIYSGDIDEYYWEYLVQTPWCDNLHKLISYIHDAPDVGRVCQLLSTDFLSILSGNKMEKTKVTLTVLGKIMSSIGSWALKTIRKPLVLAGILYD